MKKIYTKPEIELVEYKANDVIMTASSVFTGLDNDVAWLDSWITAGGSGIQDMLN